MVMFYKYREVCINNNKNITEFCFWNCHIATVSWVFQAGPTPGFVVTSLIPQSFALFNFLNLFADFYELFPKTVLPCNFNFIFLSSKNKQNILDGKDTAQIVRHD